MECPPYVDCLQCQDNQYVWPSEEIASRTKWESLDRGHLATIFTALEQRIGQEGQCWGKKKMDVSQRPLRLWIGCRPRSCASAGSLIFFVPYGTATLWTRLYFGLIQIYFHKIVFGMNMQILMHDRQTITSFFCGVTTSSHHKEKA